MAEETLQTQTLSLRISETLRKKLEEIRKLTALRRGESVSTSEIAKQLLEAAHQDRFELIDRLSNPGEALVQIRLKGEAGQMLSAIEWTVLAYFVQLGSEAFPRNPLSRESYIGILKAFDAVHRLLAKPIPHDKYYLENLPSDCRPEDSDSSDSPPPELVRQTVAETLDRLSDPATKCSPTLAARNLYAILDQQKLPGAVLLSESLFRYWPVLWRVAARGYYSVRREAVRDKKQREPIYLPGIASVNDGGYTLSFTRREGNEFSLLLSFPGRVTQMYPMSYYPMIAEFRRMLSDLTKIRPPQTWNGEHFLGYVTGWDKARQHWFRAHVNGITLGSTEDDWAVVQGLFRKAWEDPGLSESWDALSLEYGEL